MLFSRSSSQSSEGSSAPSPSSGSTSTSSASSTSIDTLPRSSADRSTDWQSKGAAGLGVISSLAAECTPLKHRYDSCFDSWFRDYLALGDSQIEQQGQQRGAPMAAFGKSRGSDSDTDARKRSIMERYDRDCGALFRVYQQCVKKAISDRDLDNLITQARKENPFPFDHQRRSDSRENNPPFPFPAARD